MVEGLARRGGGSAPSFLFKATFPRGAKSACALARNAVGSLCCRCCGLIFLEPDNSKPDLIRRAFFCASFSAEGGD